MYLTDYHCHSELSPDSSELLLQNARRAVEMGLSELCITDHFDLLTEQGRPANPAGLQWDRRVEQFGAVRAAMEGKLTLKLGIELGCGQVDRKLTGEILAHPELDFVIGSLHNVAERFGHGDYYYLRYTSQKQCYDLLDGYFEDLLDLVEADCYDVLGHIIFLKRYMTARDGLEVSFDGYMDRIRDILQGAVAHGKGMEVNTWRNQTIAEWRPILKLFKDCGGEYVTVGSDAHEADSIGLGAREAQDLLRDMGFRYVTTYEKRRPIQNKL